ncbi:hypothetical protein F5146DRAFT_994359 [Armillaria mellea]|nr:hypothetical protein F5146DRAFT_994359 [Armillaria mellea]
MASRIIGHLLCIKTDIQYFVDAVEEFQVTLSEQSLSSVTPVFLLPSPLDHDDRSILCEGVRSSQSPHQYEYDDLLCILIELYAEYNTLNQMLGEYKRILSLIRSLPEDVLREIFLSSQSDNNDGYDVLHVAVPPWSLGHVCRRWRDVAGVVSLTVVPHVDMG